MNQQNPFISVTITSYNYEKYILRGLNAIKKQTFKNFEVICVDDCSTDNSVNVIKKFIAENPQIDITLIENKENKGVLENRNVALDHAKGQYVMFCDSDDWMDENCLQVLADAAQKNNADRVIAQFRDVDQNGKILQVQDLPKHPSKWICGCHHGTLYKRDIFLNHNIRFEKYYPDDVYINVMFHQYCKNVVFVKKTIYNWFVHTDSTSRKESSDSAWMGVQMMKDVLTYTKPVYQDPRFADEKDIIELLAIKLYCVVLFHSYRKATVKKFLSEYAKVHKIMMECYPNYEKNKYTKLNSDAPVRKYAMKIIRLTVFLEKNHLIKPALVAYNILAKFIYFQM